MIYLLNLEAFLAFMDWKIIPSLSLQSLAPLRLTLVTSFTALSALTVVSGKQHSRGTSKMDFSSSSVKCLVNGGSVLASEIGRIFRSDSCEAFGLTSYSRLPNGLNFAESLALTDSDLIPEIICTARALSDSWLEQSIAKRTFS